MKRELYWTGHSFEWCDFAYTGAPDNYRQATEEERILFWEIESLRAEIDYMKDNLLELSNA